MAACGSSEPAPAGAPTATAPAGAATPATTPAPPRAPNKARFGLDPLPERFEVRGVVVDRDGEPVAEAMVMQGGNSDAHVLTDAKGAYAITLDGTVPGTVTLVAAKLGFRASGEHIIRLPEGPLDLQLDRVLGPDNEAYVYEDPGDGEDLDLENCTHCHTTFVQQWLPSAHAGATKNPHLQDLYAGVARAMADERACEAAGGTWRQGLEPGTAREAAFKCYVGGGVLSDLNPQCGGAGQPACDDPTLDGGARPTAFGACADCHAPSIDGVAGGRDLHDAEGVAFDKGVHCDFCHKVADVDLAQPPGAGQRLVMGRPSEPGEDSFTWEPVFYGPIIDVPNPLMRGSYQPKFNDSVFCAGCHQQQQAALMPGESLDAAKWPDGLPVHSTYEEWKAGTFGKAGVPCQHCHMPSMETLNSLVLLDNKRDESIVFGWERPPEDNRAHTFRGPLDASREGEPRFIDSAVGVGVEAEVADQQVVARVFVTNTGAGHAIPTGEPMRSLVLVVQAETEACGVLRGVGGMTVNDVGGALAQGVLGDGVGVDGATLTWESAAQVARPGQRVRVVRPSGEFHAYDGIGRFAGDALAPSDKGMPIRRPVGEADVVAVNGGTLTLSRALAIAPGDRVFLGEPWPSSPDDGAASRALAGVPGVAFARVLVDASGARHVPHYRAVDMASDNRIAPGATARSAHAFALDPGCGAGALRATLLYRPHPLALSAERGWDAKDYVVATAEARW